MIQAKGDLDYIEYKELTSLLATWSPFVREHFLTCLGAGTSRSGPLLLPRWLIPSSPIDERNFWDGPSDF